MISFFNLSFLSIFGYEIRRAFAGSDSALYDSWKGDVPSDIYYTKINGGVLLEKFLKPKSILVFSELVNTHGLSDDLCPAYKEYIYLNDTVGSVAFVCFKPKLQEIKRFLKQNQSTPLIYKIAKNYNLYNASLAAQIKLESDIHYEAVNTFLKSSTNEIVFDDSHAVVAVRGGNDRVTEIIRKRMALLNKKIKLIDKNSKNQNIDSSDVFPNSLRSISKITSEDIDIANDLIEFSSPKIQYNDSGFDNLSKISAFWNTESNQVVTPGEGSVVVRCPTSSFVARPRALSGKAIRLASALNVISKCNPSGIIKVDMQDARLIGADQNTMIGGPVFAYCRRKGAENVSLIPLHGYHDIGNNNFVNFGGECTDTIAYSEKLDKAIWRGNLSGHCNGFGHNYNIEQFKYAVHVVFENLVAAKSEDEISSFSELLRKNVRYNFCYLNRFSNNVDAKLVISGKREAQAERFHFFSGMLSERISREQMYKYKYIVCLRGFDTASNFITAMAGNSVAMKEEDGWELYYTKLFRPWKEYIPLSPGGMDIEEKLEWARANPLACKDIIENAHKRLQFLANKTIRSYVIEHVVANSTNK